MSIVTLAFTSWRLLVSLIRNTCPCSTLLLDRSSLTVSRNGVADGDGVTLGVAVRVAVAVAAVVGVAVGCGVGVGVAVDVGVGASVFVGVATSTASVPFCWPAIAQSDSTPTKPRTNNKTINTRFTSALLSSSSLNCTTSLRFWTVAEIARDSPNI